MKSYQYDAVIDLMLSEPGLSLSEIARRVGKSPAWITWVTKSDAFKDVYEERRRAKNEAIQNELTSRLSRVANRSLEILDERLEKNPAGVPTAMVLDVADKALERLGYGVKLPGTVIDARTQSITLTSEDFALAQSVVRGLELENSAATPVRGPATVIALGPRDAPTKRPQAVAPPVNPLKQVNPSLEELLDSVGFSRGRSPEDVEDIVEE